MARPASPKYSSVLKAAKWLSKKAPTYFPVVATPNGYAEFVAYLYKMKRDGKPSVYYLLRVVDGTPVSVYRVCMY